MRRFVQSVAAIAALTATASAQPAPPPAPLETSTSGWSVLAGYETFALRDISRSGRPPDASPVSWQGSGPSVAGRYDIGRGRSSHAFEATAARARDFSYVGPARSTAALASDLAGRFALTYEYRRYPWHDVGFDGLDIAVGAQGLATRTGFDRHITQALVTQTRITGAGFAGVIAVGLRKFERLRVDASWSNGAILSHRSARHSSDGEAESYSGGNWLSNIVVRVDWRVTPTTRLAGAWRRAYDGYSSSHYSYAGHRHAIELGLSYAR
jgi:hypothetical protein